MANIGKLTAILSLNSARFTKGLTKSRKRLSKFGRGIGSSLKGAIRALTSFKTLRAGAAVGGVGLFITKTIAAIDKTGQFGKRIGVAAGQLAGLQHAAASAGVKAETVNMALQRMTRRVAEAAVGTGEAQGAIIQLGLSAKSLAALSPDKQLYRIADAMRSVKTQGERVRLAFKLFDSEGVSLVAMLGGGSAALRKFQEDAERLGLALDENAYRKAGKAAIALDRLQKLFRGIGQTLAIELTPYITAAADGFVDMATNADRLGKNVSSALERVALSGVKTYELLSLLTNSAKGFAAALGEVAYVILAVPAGLIKLRNSQREWLGHAPKDMEFIHFVEALGETSFRAAEEVEEAFAGLASGKTAKDIKKYFRDLNKTFNEGLGGGPAGAGGDGGMAEAMKAKMVAVETAMKSAAERIREAIRSPAEKMQRSIDEAFDLYYKGFFGKDINLVYDYMHKLEDELRGPLTDAAARIFEGTRTPIEKMKEQMREAVDLFNEGFLGGNTLGRVLKELRAKIKEMLGKPEEKGIGSFGQIVRSRTAYGREDEPRRRGLTPIKADPAELKKFDRLILAVERINLGAQ